jgi:hypothetical protein
MLRICSIQLLHKKAMRSAALLAVMAMCLAFASAAGPQSHEYGYSYLHIEIGGHPMTNFVHNAKYEGWLQVESVTAQDAASSHPSKQTDADQWTTVPPRLRAAKGGPGKLEFGAGDEGGLDPLLDAQKHHTLIDHAELDLYALDGGAFLGKFRFTGIHILSVEGIPASACPMYSITLSFRSFARK